MAGGVQPELSARALGLGVRAAPFVANTTGSVSDGNRALTQARAALECGIHLGGGGLNPAVVESHNKGYTPTEAHVRGARWVLEQYQPLAGPGETSMEFEGRVIDRYEVARARDLLEWADACAQRDREKEEAVAKVQAAEGGKE